MQHHASESSCLPHEALPVPAAVVRNSWQIVATKKTYTVFAADPDEKESWMTAMNQVIDALVAKNPSLLGTPRQHQIDAIECRVSIIYK